MKSKKLYCLSVFIFICHLFSVPSWAEGNKTAKDIYKQHEEAIYQIQVIDLASNKKSSIGSGFQITADGYIASNYHVVSEAVQRPKNNKITFLTDKGKTGTLKVVAIDVIHDLSILKKVDVSDDPYINLGRANLQKGSRIYSLGNPHDIGFTIIEGTYNGLSDNSLYEKIHFSGSLNPGMSGGPALNQNGEVIGINVSTAGNQISFLVPVERLKALFVRTQFNRDTNLHNMITEQLEKNQDHYIETLLKEKWEDYTFGPLNVSGKMSKIFKCWGGQAHEEGDEYQYYRSACSSQDRLYLEPNFTTGPISYRYDHIIAKEELDLTRFYSFYQDRYQYMSGNFSNAGKIDVTNFKCRSGFVNIADRKWKSSLCMRQYKKYPTLHDAHLYMAMIGGGKIGYLTSLTMQGVTQKSALQLIKKFTDNISTAQKEEK